MGKVAVAMTTDQSTEGLRPRRCCNPSCDRMFALCRSCDRGQRYCSVACSKRMRQQQLTAAGRRYQASEAGKLNHCQRQHAYRQRQRRPPVTHQGLVSIATPQPSRSASLARCAVCGHKTRWINPFYWLPRRGRKSPQVRRSAKRQISKFLHDR